jgi:hypothetical protein
MRGWRRVYIKGVDERVNERVREFVHKGSHDWKNKGI